MSRPSALFGVCVVGYFAWQIALRLITGGALETDEAEMMVMTPGLQLGYGPQLPLYNWLQVALFEVFGRNLFALSLLKNLLLALTYILLFVGLRIWVPVGLAAVGALGLFTLPDVAWEAQRATTHSNMLLLTCAATLAAFLWVAKTGRLLAFAALGMAVGLGGLAKYNYVAVPLGLLVAGLSLPDIRARLLSVRGLLIPVVAGAITVLPYRWMLLNPELAFSSTRKLAVEDTAPVRLDGFLALLEGLAVLWVLPVLIAAGIFAIWRKGGSAIDDHTTVRQLLWRATLFLTLVALVAVPIAGVGHITPRWLLPILFLGVPALFIELFCRVSVRAYAAFYVVVGMLAVAVSIGLWFDRYKETARRAVNFAPLVAHLETLSGMPETPVVAEFYTAGNLARLQPTWTVSPYLAFAKPRSGTGDVIFVLRERTPANLQAALRQGGWPEGVPFQIVERAELLLPYDSSDSEHMRMRTFLLRFEGP